MGGLCMVSRLLSDGEVQLVEFAARALGVPELKQQLAGAQVVDETSRGGIFIDVAVPPSAPRHGAWTGPWPGAGSAIAVTRNEEDVGGLMLWFADGLLTAIEIWDVTDDVEVRLPTLDMLSVREDPPS